MKMETGDKYIKTESFQITKNVLMWNDSMIQLSNVSLITTAPLPAIWFPWYPLAALLFYLGLTNLSKRGHFSFAACLILLVGAAIGYWQYQKNENRKKATVLTLQMNSGMGYQFLIKEKEVMEKIRIVLEKIIADGGIGERSVSINIQDCTITDHASVLDGVKI